MQEKMTAKKLSHVEIASKISSWNLVDNWIEKDFQFLDFKTTFNFMSKIATVCEQMNHHPKWTNNYNQLQICLFTHDQNAITELDLQLAQQIDILFDECFPKEITS